jgi:hypothetical protein
MQVSVQIDDFFTDDQKGGLEWGNTAWNNAALIACSGVRFHDFDHVFMPSYTEHRQQVNCGGKGSISRFAGFPAMGIHRRLDLY